MKKWRLCVFLPVVMAVLLSACSANDEIKTLSQTLGVDLREGTVSQSTDSHGGFHGDGHTYVELQFSDKASDALVREMESAWSALPLTDNLEAAVYGKQSGAVSMGPYVTGDDGETLFPKVDNGYYFFRDRHGESKDAKDDAALLQRYSFNFTIAIYDTDAQTLYYYALDT